jgi:hypothetical protein
MTKTSSQMNRHSIASTFAAISLLLLLTTSCKKNDHPHHGGSPSHPADVLDRWMTLQLRLMRNATGIPNQAFSRHFAYSGVAALEALTPDLPGRARWTPKWNGVTGLPSPERFKKYHTPASVNAAMATINRAMFTNASVADKAAIDSLEGAIKQQFISQKASVIAASESFGKAVANAVYNWSETDGYKYANTPYTVPAGPGLWKPTAPAFSAPATPFWGQNRTLISGSIAGAQPAAPPAYSIDPTSAFYQMVKEVYDASQVLTDDQKAMAIFWRDVPGATSPGHWLSILQQVVRQDKAPLHKAALAYALTGIAINDALIACFKTKYQHNLVRPITYIREVMGHAAWNSFIGTPAHPEYVSAHSSLSAAAAAVLEKLFGNCGSFTDHTYDYLALTSRSYPSYTAIGDEAGKSRLYGGIHYTVSINAGLVQGRKVAENIFKCAHGVSEMFEAYGGK